MTIAKTPGDSPSTQLAEGAPGGFPPGFLWGAATAAYQIEGAVSEDGRGPSIWDLFARTPGKVLGGDTGDVAADHYHRWPQDVALMREIGLKAYRFSVAWPRVQPGGTGPANERGLDFYRRLVEGLLEAGIVPVVTLYHWDLPQPLQDAGGWPRRDTAYRFAEYATLVLEALGDRVSQWATLNEPWCSAFLGYGNGVHAPGIQDPQQSVAAAHHLMLGHGLAVQAMRAAAGGRDLSLGIVLNPAPMDAASDAPVDIDAARRADGMQNRIFLDPILKGVYPEDVLADLAEEVDLSHIHDGDEGIIASPIDVLGINYYRRFTVAEAWDGSAGADPRAEAPIWPGANRITMIPRARPLTAMGWEVDASGLLDLLVQVRRTYGPIPLQVMENGAAYEDLVDARGGVHDLDRIEYLRQHVHAALQAIEAGVDLRGYFVWSLLDNFEWAEGYARRFGIVYVDYATQRRILKDSASWYRRVIADNGLTPSTRDGT